MTLVERLLAIHNALDRATIPHAFGGAIALAYCTAGPRGTRDIDVNIFVGVDQVGRVLASLPDGIAVTDKAREALGRDGQARLWWDETPVDLFFSVDPFHAEVAATTRTVAFGGATIPILDCAALVVFKAMFSRPKDWVDIGAMLEEGTVETTFALGWLTRLLGPDHDSTRRLATLVD